MDVASVPEFGDLLGSIDAALLLDSSPQPVNATETMKRLANNNNIGFFTALLDLLILNPHILSIY
ncbi:hypothetical protein GCM10008018_20900 [Paenibacillus marchantiophytorum]|uniref:FAS1 domain-containing protein n=1 Tax=Paenibacillus marchantiophytorum TaxID=1619310 RepID=A0ABQ1EK31_9BACL|nr:hypothetical protein GCM10008018_20900 [Paenibacillus marchantiophytorum]